MSLSLRVFQRSVSTFKAAPACRFYTTQQSDPRRIYIAGLPFTASESEVKSYFSQFGQVEEIYMPKFAPRGQDVIPDRNKGFAFLVFSSQDDASKAVGTSGHRIGDRDVIVEAAKPREERAPREPREPRRPRYQEQA